VHDETSRPIENKATAFDMGPPRGHENPRPFDIEDPREVFNDREVTSR